MARRAVLARDPICKLCDNALSTEVDHIVPLSQGATRTGSKGARASAPPVIGGKRGLRTLGCASGLSRLLLFVQLSSERARHALRQDCSFAKQQDSPPALPVVV